MSVRSVEPEAQRTIKVVDSHTGGEPTRVVVRGGPNLGRGTLLERFEVLRRRHDRFRSAVVNEPRGSDALVGALLLEPDDSSMVTAAIFFNNVGYLGMCGHGTMGIIATLAHLGRIAPGKHRLETPVGAVTAWLQTSGGIAVENVPSYRHAKGVQVDVGGHGRVTGDIAWGGNWFFLVEDHGEELELARVGRLTDLTWRIRQALERQGIRGRAGEVIDHIELTAASPKSGAQSRNFVLCPGKAYDRSPCGTGTSAKLACLFADGKLKEGEVWRQESITGSVFEGSVKLVNGKLIPTVEGSAFVNAEATLILNPLDPCSWGIRSVEEG